MMLRKPSPANGSLDHTGFKGLDRLDSLLAIGLGLVSFGLYVRTLQPGLLPNDSAEFQVLAYTLDHAHTTGYHVYLVLAKLFTFLPVGEIAYRVNLFSAFMGGLTVALVYLNGRVLSGSRWGGGLGAAALALSATFWSQATIAEVYTPGSVFTGAILISILLWQKTRQPVWLFWAGLLGGLGIGVHGSVILLAPAVAILLLLYPREVGRSWKPALAGVLLGLCLLIAAFALVDYRPGNASMMNIYISSISRWDLTPDQLDSFWERFAFLIFAQQWRSAMFVDPGSVIPTNFGSFMRFFSIDFCRVVHLLIVVGFFSLLTRSWRLGLFFLSAIIFHAVYTLNYRIGDIYVFFISFYVYLLTLAAEGTALLFRGLKLLQAGWARILHPVLGIGLIVLALAPLIPSRADMLKEGRTRWDFMALPSEVELESWHELIAFNVADLPENAIVLMGWRDLYGYTYVAQVEQDRPDLLFIEAYPYSVKAGMADSLLEYLKTRLMEGRPVFTAERLDELERGGLSLTERPVGVTRMYEINIR